jgi:hypothetical protein
MAKNIVQADGPQIRRPRFGALHAEYVRLQTHTHAEYVILVCTQQQWLHECASMALHEHCLSCCYYVYSCDDILLLRLLLLLQLLPLLLLWLLLLLLLLPNVRK